MGVAVLNDKIYAVGGFDGSTGLNSAEVREGSSFIDFIIVVLLAISLHYFATLASFS